MEIYDLGYSALKDLDLLVQTALALDAVVVDIRLNPRSRNPIWNRKSLTRHLGDRYVHVPELGNVNYKNGGPVKLLRPEVGLDIVQLRLLDNPVILLCACKDRETCHRLTVAQELQDSLGVRSQPLDRSACLHIVESTYQLPMFPQEN